MSANQEYTPAKFSDYVRMARIDHWFKNIFVIPGVVVAAYFVRPDLGTLVFPVLIGLLSVCLAASANYVLNEWLDMATDRHHRHGLQKWSSFQFRMLHHVPPCTLE